MAAYLGVAAPSGAAGIRETGRVLKVDAVTGVRTLFASYTGAEDYALLLRPIPVPPPVP